MSRKILIANRGALRLVRAVRDLRIAGIAVFADDDTQAPHVRHADATAALGASGPVAYLDLERLLAIAREHGCDAVHPGYGFLAERADFAQACEQASIAFVARRPSSSPSPATRCGRGRWPASAACRSFPAARAPSTCRRRRRCWTPGRRRRDRRTRATGWCGGWLPPAAARPPARFVDPW